MIVTGKGYADYSTKYVNNQNNKRNFLKRVWNDNPCTIFYYLGDYDPHGISILFDYTFGNQF